MTPSASQPKWDRTTNPIRDTVETIPGMPSKLKIYRNTKSKFWWTRIFVNGRYRIKSTRTSSRREARVVAKDFFFEVHMYEQIERTRMKTSTLPRDFESVGHRYADSLNIVGQRRRYLDERQRLQKELVPFFQTMAIDEITSADIGSFQKHLFESGKLASTVGHYIGVLRRVVKFAFDNRLITALPNFPRIPGRSKQTARDYFPDAELAALVTAVEQMAAEGEKISGIVLTLEFKYLIQFMVSSFIRPSDLRVLRNRDVFIKVATDASGVEQYRYLELHHSATKTTDREVVTMPEAYGVYQSLLEVQKARGYGSGADYVFLPQYKNRNTMMVMAGRIFRAVLNRSGIEQGDDKHTLYSLRHTAIMRRLLAGDVDTLILAKNARTSQAMIDKFYASRLSPSQVVGVLHGQTEK